MSVAWFRIEHMIEPAGLDRRGTLADARACLTAQRELDAHQLALAGHWADLHHPDNLPAATTELERRRRRFSGEYGVRPGGSGTPEVLASCFSELGGVLQTSALGARHLVADALDLRHRLPQLWTDVRAGRVRGWQARRVAAATRQLPLAAMAGGTLGWPGCWPCCRGRGSPRSSTQPSSGLIRTERGTLRPRPPPNGSSPSAATGSTG